MSCEVCGSKDETKVFSSYLGPFSFSYCGNCLSQNAEPKFAFEFILESVGKDVAPHVKDLKTFAKGEYISWDDWVKDK